MSATIHPRSLASSRAHCGSTSVVSAAEQAWAEALVRFEDVANPETGLDADQVAHFRHRLLGLLDETIDRVAAINAVRRSRGGGEGAVDPLLRDRVATHRADIEAIGAALAAIDAGVYGTCLGCRRPVGVDMLTDCPWARRCAGCARAAPDGVPVPDQRLTEAGR